MFWQKHPMRALATQPEPLPLTTLLTDIATPSSLSATDGQRAIQLGEVLGGYAYELGAWKAKANILGFCWFLQAARVSSLPYAASVGRAVESRSRIEVNRRSYATFALGDSQAIVYAGDIPDFCLERIRLAQNELQVTYVTIHSQVPLPVQVLDLRPIDPVVVGWRNNPYFRTGAAHLKGWQPFVPQEWGVVLAVWGADHESINL